jgi:hypothetical protein
VLGSAACVLEHEQRRPLAHDREQHVAQVEEQAHARAVRLRRLVAQRRVAHAGELAQQRRRAPRRLAAQGAPRERVIDQQQERRVRRGELRIAVPNAHHHRRAVSLRQLLDKPRLADPARPAHEGELRPQVLRGREQLLELLELFSASDQRGHAREPYADRSAEDIGGSEPPYGSV